VLTPAWPSPTQTAPGQPAAASPGIGWTAQPDERPSARSAQAAPDPVGPGGAFGSTGATDEDDELELEEQRPRHPYTWLHLLVLALVAFVLGFLIMLLVVNGRGDKDDKGAAPTSASAPVAAVVPTV